MGIDGEGAQTETEKARIREKNKMKKTDGDEGDKRSMEREKKTGQSWRKLIYRKKKNNNSRCQGEGQQGTGRDKKGGVQAEM